MVTHPYQAGCTGSLVVDQAAAAAESASAWQSWQPVSCLAEMVSDHSTVSLAPGASSAWRTLIHSPDNHSHLSRPPRGWSCPGDWRCRVAAEVSDDSSRRLSWWCEVCQILEDQEHPETWDCQYKSTNSILTIKSTKIEIFKDIWWREIQ